MNWASYILSFCLHVLIILLIWLWPASPPVRLDAPPVMISLVDGAPGGNRTPSSILGAAGQPTSGPKDFAAPAPKAEVAAPAATPPQAEPIKSPPKEAAQDRSPKDEVKEAPRPRPKPDDNAAALLAKKKKEEEAKRRQEERERQQAELKKKEEERREAEQKKKEEERKKAEQKKKEEARKKAEQKKKEEERKKAEQERKEKEKDSVAAALRDARRKASSRVESGDRGTAVEQALAQARKNAGGDGGGGGGEGDGPGGGGLNEVYLGQIMLAVRPNWSFASASRANFACIVHVSVDMNGEVQDAQVTQGSGNAQFDASAVNAVIRTGKAGLFPKPPSPEYCEVDLVFRMDELSRR
ncbi:MAG: cell envelope integrity protein TolA [Desulfovibrio sp.]|uniref:cell envelope integrity protein TolA n=1 Tax=Desulfovibrio sp. TaxID=885 RepID=UPI0025C61CBC|nr:cell envelope integrity protein TolA [Desulfovibrio sp.]MCI7569853.1 cell envelope integrity protein TolA [Desulfovibrio sp.]